MSPKDWRISQKLSLGAMGAKIGRTAVSVMRYESGERFPEPETVTAYAQVTDGAVGYEDFVAIRNARVAATAPAPGAAA